MSANENMAEMLKKLTTVADLRAKLAQLESELPKALLKLLDQPSAPVIKLTDEQIKILPEKITEILKKDGPLGMRKLRAGLASSIGGEPTVEQVKTAISQMKGVKVSGQGPATKFALK